MLLLVGLVEASTVWVVLSHSWNFAPLPLSIFPLVTKGVLSRFPGCGSGRQGGTTEMAQWSGYKVFPQDYHEVCAFGHIHSSESLKGCMRAECFSFQNLFAAMFSRRGKYIIALLVLIFAIYQQYFTAVEDASE